VKQLTLCLAVHNHQPVGNFPWVFAEAYQRAYLPMLECLERHPGIRMSMHYTGPLIDWLRENRPDFFPRVAAMVQRRQVELMTGGYYEPILPAIPEADRLGQIRKLTDFLESELGSRATGMWLAERVWEPQLPSTLARAGVEWTIVDDTHFKMSGLTDADLRGYFLTEDQGETLKVFATSKRLRYVIPFHPVEEVMQVLTEAASEDPHEVLVMGDDGEKFGIWPGTYDHCWTNGWMERFFQALEANDRWLQVIPVGEYAAAHPAQGRIYLPTASYAEMMEWALPAAASEQFHRLVHDAEANHREDLGRFLRGGFWRNFLVKYPEVNTMHKKMLRVHRKVQATADKAGPDAEAQDQLWQAQCNCPYWHGLFGGIYMTDVRTATFQHLIHAEVRADALRQGTAPWIVAEQTDLDCDSYPEAIVESSRGAYYLSPQTGGALFEWDVRGDHPHNLVSVLSRRPEAYHTTLREAAAHAGQSDDAGAKTIHEIVHLKQPGLEKLLHYDWYRRACLIDHFLAPGTTQESFAACTYREAGDFVDQPYETAIQVDGTRCRVTLSRAGHVWSGPEFRPLRLEKTLAVTADAPGFTVTYRLHNPSDRPLTVTFGSEFNLNLLGGGGNPTAYRQLIGDAVADGRFDANGAGTVRRVSVGNHYLALAVTLAVSQPATAWWSSIESVSSSEGGFERVHQGSSLLFSWPLRLEAGAAWDLQMTADVGAGD
jgi:hypothetical protein